MIKAEYIRFLQTLNNPATSEGVRKIANIILANVDTLIPLSTQQGQRVKKVVELAKANWQMVSPDIQPAPENLEGEENQIRQLKSISVGPFRGFASQEHFDLDNRLVLIYGPNGTGKSSFCEALEYGLLGNVADADSKRFRNQGDYLKNAYANRYVPPVIVAENDTGEDITITSNEVQYRFCFVEKNRIDNFSRIAAQAPAKQTELISTLFGLDSFTDFVRNFTAEIDGRYIDLIGVKAITLLQKRQSLAGSHQQIQASQEEIQRIDNEEKVLAVQYRQNITFDQLVLELNGNDQVAGLIQNLEAEMQKPIPAKSNMQQAGLEALGNAIAANVAELSEKQSELTNLGSQVSYKQLYEAVSQVQQSSPEQCPACKTPIVNTILNPYLHATEELQKLQHLGLLQGAIQQIEQNLVQQLFSLKQMLDVCLRIFPNNNSLQPFQILDNIQPNLAWWNSLLLQMQDGHTAWQHLVGQVQYLEKGDVEIEQATQIREVKNKELARLRQFANQITILRTRRQAANKTITDANTLIANFDVVNAQLISEAEGERAVIQANQNIAESYRTFVERLNGYKDSLPAQLVADLGDTIVTIYNAFNRNDAPGDLLAAVKLPLAQNERLEISFERNPEVFFDALHVLSEGHIRCVGLAILLAKNLNENCPLLIFDDPVNAIDEDHRESIRKTLFEDPFFAHKQIILTCHGEEFYKDIQNLLPRVAVEQSKRFTFLPRNGDSHILIDFNCEPRNYILSAQSSLQRLQVREALAKARQALEVLTKDKIWRYVSRYGDGNLSIKMRSSTAPIELRQLAEQLKSQINKQDFADADKQNVLAPLVALLGMNGDSREWRYLNKGTHEETDRAEFDRQTVAEIIGFLTQLDVAVG